MKPDDFKDASPAIRSLTEPTGSIADLLDVELAAARILNNPELLHETEKQSNNFGYMLRYLVRNDIPDLAATTDNILQEAQRLRREILREYNVVHSPRSYYASVRYQRLRPEENLESLVSDYLSELNRRSNDPTTMMSNTANARLEDLSNDIFERIRTVRRFSEHSGLILSLIVDNTIPEADRVIWVAGVALGELEMQDDDRVTLLMDALSQGNISVQVAASVWLALTVPPLIPDNFSNAEFRIEEIKRNPNRQVFAQALFEVVRLAVLHNMPENERSKIIPSMEAMLRNINLPKNADTARDLMTNPDKMASSPEVYEWMHRFNDAVREGYDVQEGSLGKLRHWNFFGKLSNWLLPFDPNHSALAGIADEDGAPLANMLTKMGSLIDSDKYALVLSLSNLPASMREAAMQGTMNQMGINSDEFQDALDDEAKEAAKLRTRVNNYAKQVWRIFSSHPKRDEFVPNDNFKLYTESITVVRDLFDDELLRRFADMLLKLKDGSNSAFFNQLIKERTDSDDRALARTSLMTRNNDMSAYQDYIENHPDDIELVLEGVEAGMNDRYTMLALEAHEDIDSENIPFLKSFVKALMSNGRYNEAADRLMALEYLDADNSETYRKLRGRALVLNAQWDDAVEALDNIVPKTAEEIATHSFALWMGHRRSESLSMLEKHKSNPDLTKELEEIRGSFPMEENRNTQAMFRYLLDSWHFILNDINPINI